MPDDFWEKDFGITPQAVSNTVILRAAHQMKKQYGKKAALEASKRCNAALEVGDNFNYELWLMVTMAINEIDFTNPSYDETIN